MYDWNSFHILRKKKLNATISESESHQLEEMNIEATKLDQEAAARQQEAIKPILEKHNLAISSTKKLFDQISKFLNK